MPLASIANQTVALSLSVRIEDLQLLEQIVTVLQDTNKLKRTRTMRLAIRDWLLALAREKADELLRQGHMLKLPSGETMTPMGQQVFAIPASATSPHGTVVAALATPQGLPLIQRQQVFDPVNPNATPEALKAFGPYHSAVVRSVNVWFALGHYTSPARYAGLPQPRDIDDHLVQAVACGATWEYCQAARTFHDNPGKFADVLLDPNVPDVSTKPVAARAAASVTPLRPLPQDDFPAHWNEPPSAEEEARAHRVLDEISRNDALTARKARIDAEDAAERQRQRDATPEEDPFDTDAQWRAAGLNPDPLAPT